MPEEKKGKPIEDEDLDDVDVDDEEDVEDVRVESRPVGIIGDKFGPPDEIGGGFGVLSLFIIGLLGIVVGYVIAFAIYNPKIEAAQGERDIAEAAAARAFTCIANGGVELVDSAIEACEQGELADARRIVSDTRELMPSGGSEDATVLALIGAKESLKNAQDMLEPKVILSGKTTVAGAIAELERARSKIGRTRPTGVKPRAEGAAAEDDTEAAAEPTAEDEGATVAEEAADEGDTDEADEEGDSEEASEEPAEDEG